MEERDVRVEDRDVRVNKTETKEDRGLVASTFIKYTAYLIIFFGIIWFIISYLLPMLP
ncbi:hypothetical protein LG307_15010 [Sutcliffiella horikoshii]|uniref:hypothetical protein n=1 Tax=Sutcliffiella horikoshii TaxID=79883 RepID=UPI00384E0B36